MNIPKISEILILLSVCLPLEASGQLAAEMPAGQGAFDDLVPARISSESGTVWTYTPKDVVRISDSVRRIWINADHKNDRTVKHRSTKYLFQIDCSQGKSKTLVDVKYTSKGQVVSELNRDERVVAFAFIVPNTMMAALQKRICLQG